MLRTLAQRLVQAVIVLAGVMLLIFVMLRIVPGNPVETLMGEHANQETIARVSEEMGLDQPLHIQFFRYLSSALQGDFGTSFTLGKPVSRLLRSAFVNTLILALFAALFAWIIGIGCGVLAAVSVFLPMFAASLDLDHVACLSPFYPLLLEAEQRVVAAMVVAMIAVVPGTIALFAYCSKYFGSDVRKNDQLTSG